MSRSPEARAELATARPAARRAPGPRALPLAGHLPGFLADKLGYLARVAARYGDVVRLRLGEPTLLLAGAEDVKHVLVTNAENYDKSPRLTSERGRRLSGHGLLTSLGEEHRARRRLLQPAFHRSAIEPFAALFVRNAAAAIDRWRDGERLDVAAEMMHLAQRNVLASVFGADLPAEIDELCAAIDVRRRYMEHVFFVPFGDRLPSRIGAAFAVAMRRIVAAVDEAIGRRRAAAVADDAADDLLSALLRAVDGEGRGMSDAEIRDEAITLLVTGYETLGEALGWTWYLLARHPDAARELAAEADRTLGDRQATAADAPLLRHAGRVLNEAMRIYPPTWIFIRMARGADVLPSGFAVDPGTKIYLSPWVVHRDERYFPEPLRFDPGRFADDVRRERPQFAYFPFGGGGRVCIGEALARLEGVLVLATVAQRFRLELLSDPPVVPVPRMTLRARHGIWMTVRRRSAGDGRLDS